jgi:ribosomal protein L40E
MNFAIAGIFVVFVIVAFLVFGVWLLVTLLRGTVRLFFGPSNPSPRKNVAVQQQSILLCNRPDCMTQNPTHAQFCRRCGQRLTAAQIRRVA